MATEFAVITDTATLAVYDVQAIRHRETTPAVGWFLSIKAGRPG